MLRRVAALGIFVAVLAGSLAPCPEPPPEAPAAVVMSAIDADSDAWCRRTEPPQLLPTCPCACAQRPDVAGVPVGVGLAMRSALTRLIVPPAHSVAPALPALRASAGVVRTPDPVPLSV